MQTTHHQDEATVEARRHHGAQGFTLIELLLVIAILGVLSAVALFSVRGVNGRGDDAACVATKTSVTTAAETYFAQTGANATSLATLTTGGYLIDAGNVSGNTITGKGSKWTVTYNPSATPMVSSTGTCTP
jgi:general secretion pathway protein G